MKEGNTLFTFNLAFGPAVQTLRASSSRTVDDTQTLQLHTRADRPLALLLSRVCASIVRLVWLGRYFDTEIRLSSAACEMR
jgi:hypothetical protein